MNKYDSQIHKYFIDDNEIPSVTQIIPKQNFYVSDKRLEETRQEGSEIHSLIKYYFDTGYIGDNTMLKSLDEWLNKNKELTGELLFYEKPLFQEHYKFAGKPDAVFENCIIDFKRSFGNKKNHALQLAGYNILINKNIDNWFILFYDEIKNKFYKRSVFDFTATNIFLSLVEKYYIDKNFNLWMNKK